MVSGDCESYHLSVSDSDELRLNYISDTTSRPHTVTNLHTGGA